MLCDGMAIPVAPERRQGVASRSAGLQEQGTAPSGFEPEVAPDQVDPDESDLLSEEVARRIDDVFNGKRKLTSYSSAAEYLAYVRKMLNDEPVENRR